MLTVARTVRSGLAQSILFAWLAVELFAWPAAKPAFAAEPPSACPNREAVALAVRALLRPSHVDTAGVETQFEVLDFGDHYAVTVKGRRREYSDEPRDCAKRAHIAAVFIALTLAPPDIPLPEQPEPAPPAPASSSSAPGSAPASSPPASASAPAPASSPPASASAPAPAPASASAPASSPPAPAPPIPPWSLELDLGALLLAAPRSSSSQTAVGAELRVSVLHSSQWGLTLGAHVATPSTLDLDGVPVHESRIPFDLGVRRNLRTGRLEASLELGLAAALTRLRQTDLPNAQTETRLELGARAAGRLSWNAAISPYLSVFTQIFPFPHELFAEPRGSIGHTSPLWLGASLGLQGKFP